MSVQIHPCLQLLQPPNLRNKLISRRLPSDQDVTNNGSKPCNKKRKLCNQINPSKSIKHSKLQYFRIVMLCTLSSAENVAKDLVLAKQDRSCKQG
ncbi:unnamed protein product [Staurois parvus]|uniref:Uncharacterized protein n=1 Tax=Staurois parvus TaxID=386267 RepID=A0ABN9FDL9_9NEOB|nr:unnamed protein product [Staurois parvus]